MRFADGDRRLIVSGVQSRLVRPPAPGEMLIVRVLPGTLTIAKRGR